jgi:hypothetical protein
MRQYGRTPLTAAIALFLALAVMFAGPLTGFTQQDVAEAATSTTGVSVTVSSPASGTKTFDAAGNGTSANDVLVLPGEQVTLNATFNTPAVSDRVHYREDASTLSADQQNGGAPIVWGWAPSNDPYVLGVFPQNPSGGDLSEPIYIRVFSINPILTATPDTVVANGPQVTIIPAFTPTATAKFIFDAGFGPFPATTNANSIVQYSVPGRYVPSVKFLNAADQVIGTANANPVTVKFADPNVQCDRNNPLVGQAFTCVLTGVDYEPGANFKWSWTDQNGAHEFNSANAFRAGQQASPNTFTWTASAAFDFDLSVVAEFTDGVVFFEVGQAQTHIDVQPGATLNPSIAITLPSSANENELINIKIVASDVVTGAYAVILTGLPGVAPYNPVNDGNVSKVWVGNTVTMNVPFAFSPAGVYTPTATLDAVINGQWASGVDTAKAPIRINGQQTNPGSSFQPVLKIIANNATQNVTTTLRIEATGILTHEFAVRLLGLPSGEYNVTLGASNHEVQVENIPNGKAFLVPFKFSQLGQVALTAQMDAVVDGGWKANVATASLIIQVRQTMIYLPITRVPPTALNVTVTPAQPVVPKTITLKVNEINGYSFRGPVNSPDADQVIWKVERQDGANWVTVLNYNSTAGANSGEQPSALQVTFWPERAGTYRYSVHIDRVIGASWATTAEASGGYTVLEK